MTSVIRVLGLDVAAVNSGAAVVEVKCSGPGEIDFKILTEQHLRTSRIAANQPPSWESMLEVARDAIELTHVHGVTHVAYEGYAKMSRRVNTTAYEHAELVGVLKYGLYQCGGLKFVQIPPTTLISFFSLTKGDKNAAQVMLKEKFGWVSSQRYTKWRSDCSDAAAHAILAGYLFNVIEGWDPGDALDPNMTRVLFGDERSGSKMVGVLHRPHLYIPRDACIGGTDGKEE